jgi:phage RecT family recombinase
MTKTKQVTVAGQICTAIDKMQESLNETLRGTGVSVNRFLATAKTAVQTHSDQKGLESADRASLYLAIKKAAGDGLMPDGREAALVVYNTKQKDGSWAKQVQYQPMVQGLVKLARKSGEIEKLGAFVVYEKDSFKFQAGKDDIPVHSAPTDENGNHLWFSDNRGEPIGVWAFVKLKNGEYIDPVMLTTDRINRIATRSKISKNYNPTEGQDWEEWWKKAAIRNILKYAPKSTSLEQTMNEMESEFDFASESVTHDPKPINPVNGQPKTESKAAKVIKETVLYDDDGVIDIEPDQDIEVEFEEDEDIPV